MRDRFLKIYKENIHREGADKLLEWLEDSDFFRAPASTKYHESYDGGLCEHSVRVWDELIRLLKAFPEVRVTAETAAIVSLLHDLCKVGCYKVEYRNKKNEFGKWISSPVFVFKEDYSFGGHGSKSVYLIQRFMPLTEAEATAINCHMGASPQDYSVYDAYRQFPLAFLVHTADMAATIKFE